VNIVGQLICDLEKHMKNNFEKFGIEHLSPSSCNLFVASPAAFVMQKVMGKRSSVGASAHRGTAVEAGIAFAMNSSGDVAGAIETCKQEFNRLTSLSTDPRQEKEAAAIADMVIVGYKELAGYGKPTSMQGKIEYKVEGLAVPMIGFYDFAWEDHGILIDLKTTHALPSKISTSHARQVALYIAALGDNMSARVTYVTSKKSATYELENKREHVEALGKIALTIQRFLGITDDPCELASLVAPDVDSFYFGDTTSRQQAFDIWGL
jgi:PD-(D/E)XK nuclease superfamily